MNTCITCELLRSKLKCVAMNLIGKSFEEMADKLTEDNGTRYYYCEGLKTDIIFRLNTVAPYLPYTIYEKERIK